MVSLWSVGGNTDCPLHFKARVRAYASSICFADGFDGFSLCVSK